MYFYEWRDNIYHSRIWNIEQSPIRVAFGLCDRFGIPKLNMQNLSLVQPSGWLIYNLHGLDDEGWGPVRAEYLEALLARLVTIENVKILPVGQALEQSMERSH